MRVKIFHDTTCDSLEKQINDFLSSGGIMVVDQQLQTTLDRRMQFTVMITYVVKKGERD